MIEKIKAKSKKYKIMKYCGDVSDHVNKDNLEAILEALKTAMPTYEPITKVAGLIFSRDPGIMEVFNTKHQWSTLDESSKVNRHVNFAVALYNFNNQATRI